jgi:23S rRNA (cytosine1962-C5)-methyltransferase
MTHPASSHLLVADWPAHALLDSGNRMRLERIGDMRLARHEPKAWWKPDLPDSEWKKADAVYDAEGNWHLTPSAQREWTVSYGRLALLARITGSKHVGIFPEQAPHWQWIAAQAGRAGDRPLKLLNLFGYTGVASLVAADAGFAVTHVDASKPAIAWGRENMQRCGRPDLPIRWILDDARKFVAREIRRGNRYDAILMDPPSFGRGPRSEVWKVEDQLPLLLQDCAQLLSQDALFMLVTLYAIAASPFAIDNLLQDTLGARGGRIEVGELALRHGQSNKHLALSLFGRWSNR